MRPFVLLQHLLPKMLLTRCAGAIARHEGGGFTRSLIERFIRHYGVNMEEAHNPDPRSYRSFNDFFTRALRDDARPLADSALICPVDGAVSQLGAIRDGRIFQAKGHDYTATELLGGDEALAEGFRNGNFATIYLSPRDYHRIHMPCDGLLRQMVYVPGSLYSVNPTTVAGVPGLFARNERVVCVFEGAFGPWVLVLVGATIVGSMATTWHGVVNPPRPGRIVTWEYPAEGREVIRLERGDEMGRFLLGSTVVMLFPEGAPTLPDWRPGQKVRMGQAMSPGETVAPDVLDVETRTMDDLLQEQAQAQENGGVDDEATGPAGKEV
ncbi:MAG: archaetidylserine decarboxylase [Lautropia sp.]|nr:archaetidylserine decarboxylase [Lautropia sp.]